MRCGEIYEVMGCLWRSVEKGRSGDTDRDGRVLDHPNTLREHDAARKIAAKSLGDRDAVGAEAGGAACRVEESDGRSLARHDVASEGVVPVAAWQPPRAVC